MGFLHKILPIVGWLPGYRREHLNGDMAAGLTVGVMLIPQGMAYALIAGLPPVYGLYASIVPPVIYALLGTSRQLSVAPVAMDSLLVAAGVSAMAAEGTEAYIALAILLAFFMGTFQLLLGFFRLGFITNLLSRPVISGFTSAAALIIGFSQLKYLLGIDLERTGRVHEIVWNTLQRIDETHLVTLMIGIAGIVIIKTAKKIHRNTPGALLAVIFGTVLVYLLRLDQSGVSIVREIPDGLPALVFPSFSPDEMRELIPLALTISLVAYMEAFSVAKALEAKKRDYKVLPNKELIALGAANVVGALFQSYPVTGGFSRSAVNYQAGANTQLSSFISAGLVAVTLIFLTPLFYYLPLAILASVILVAVANLIDFRYAFHLWRTNKTELILLLTTFLVTLNFSMVPGIFTGIVLSILVMIYRIAYPHIAVMGRFRGHYEYRNINRFPGLEQWENLLIIRIDAPLLFVNIQYLKDFVEQKIRRNDRLEAVIVDASAVSHIDATAMDGIRELTESLKRLKIKLLFAELVGPVRDALAKSGLINDLRENVFLNIDEAVDFVKENKPPEHKAEAMQTNPD